MKAPVHLRSKSFAQQSVTVTPSVSPPSYSAAQMTGAALHALSLGLALVPVAYGGKRPLGQRWNDPAHLITTPNGVSRWHTPANIGVQLGASGLISLDIDDLDLSRAELSALGVDLDQLLSAHPHPIRGRGWRLWYRAQTDETITATRQLQVGGRTAFELRAGHGAQDVAPGSLHPSGIVYAWAKTAPQCRDDLPALPDTLRCVYAALGNRTPKRDDVAAPVTAAKARSSLSNAPSQGGSVIDTFNARVTVAEVLTRNGYKAQGAGRFLSPHSGSGMAGVTILGDGLRAYSHHGGDSWAGRAEDAFGLLTALEHDGNRREAVKAAARELGMTQTRPTPTTGAEAVTAAQAVGLWAEHGEDLLSRVSEHLGTQEMHHHARAAMLTMLGHIYASAGEHLSQWREGLFTPAVGGLKVFSALIGGHSRSVRARLDTAAALGLLTWAPVDSAHPERGYLIALPADPRTVIPKMGRAVLRPATRAVLDADGFTVTPHKQPGKEGGDGNKIRRAARQNPLRDLLPVALTLSQHRGLTVPELAARLRCRVDTVRRKLARLDELGYLRPDGGLRCTFREFWADLRAVGGDMARDRLTGVLQGQAVWAAQALTTRAAADPQERARLTRALHAAQSRLDRLDDGEAPWSVLTPVARTHEA